MANPSARARSGVDPAHQFEVEGVHGGAYLEFDMRPAAGPVVRSDRRSRKCRGADTGRGSDAGRVGGPARFDPPQPGDVSGVARAATGEHRRSGHQHLRSCLHHLFGGLGVDATVDLDGDPPVTDRRGQCRDLSRADGAVPVRSCTKRSRRRNVSR